MSDDDPRPGPRCLVTGATGYIGGRLVPELLEAGHRVRCLARSPAKLRDYPWSGDAEVVRGDVTDAGSVAEALRGIDVAYYLVHALGTGRDFEETDRKAARIFGEQARAAGVSRIVYLGGLTPEGVPEERLSPHLRSRAEVGRILLESGVPTTVLRAAVIIGSGSASFEMLRYLTERLPVMVTPRWVRTRIQPIGVRDVLRTLVGSARMPAEVNRAFDIGGPEVLTYLEMMQRYAAVAGLPRRLILPVPVLTPGLSSHWVGLVTPVPASIARPLTESLRHEVVCREHDIARYVPDPPGRPFGFDEAVSLALQRVRDAQVTTRWSSASVPGAPSDPLPTDPDWAGGSLYTDQRERSVDAPPAALWRVIEGIGGENGWYSFPPAWALRGGWTGWWAVSACGADGATPPGCGWATRSTSGASRRSSRAAAAAARGNATAGPRLAGDVRRGRRRERVPLPATRPVPSARPAGTRLLVEHLALPRRRVRRHGPQHRQGGGRGRRTGRGTAARRAVPLSPASTRRYPHPPGTAGPKQS